MTAQAKARASTARAGFNAGDRKAGAASSGSTDHQIVYHHIHARSRPRHAED